MAMSSEGGEDGRYCRTGVGGRMLLAVRRGTHGCLLITLTHYKVANIENEYSGTELAV